MLLIILMLILGANALYFKSDKVYKTSWICLILYAGLRYHYGNDYISYEIHYTEIKSITTVINSIYEIGYCAVLYILKKIGVSFRGYIFLIAVVAVGVKVMAINKLSKDKYTSLLGYFLLFYIFNDTEQIRHGLALGLCLLAMNYIIKEEKNYKKFYALAIIALSFHYSAVVFLVAPLVVALFDNKKIIIAATVGIVILAALDVTNILIFINSAFIQSIYIGTKLTLYQNQELPILTTSLLVRVYTLGIVYQMYRKNPGDIVLKNSLKLYYFGVLLFVGFTSLEIIATRGSIFYRYIEIILLGAIFDKDQDKWIRIQAYALGAYYVTKFIVTIINPIYWNYTIM